MGNVSRAAYYKWLNREIPTNEIENERIAETIEQIHTDSPDKGYRRIRDDLERNHDIKVNDKDKIKVNTGLEVDYIEGYEEELRESSGK